MPTNPLKCDVNCTHTGNEYKGGKKLQILTI